jgi:hypothetical protein
MTVVRPADEDAIVKHKLDHIRALKEMLAQLPAVAVPATELTTLEAVKLLRPEVTSLQRKGYSFEMIAKVLKEHGLTVTASTLKKYRCTRKQGSVRKIGKNQAEAAEPVPTQPRAPSTARPKGSHQVGRAGPGTANAAGFTPLEDTRDI